MSIMNLKNNYQDIIDFFNANVSNENLDKDNEIKVLINYFQEDFEFE